MEIATKYEPQIIEDKWYKFWDEHQMFASTPNEKPPYTIVIPPPNVTGVLHMGHMLNNTIQDVLIRRARMMGFNALWVPGTDHASIATEAKVVALLKEKGIEKNSLTREAFLEHAWEWKEKHGGIILQQLRKLGASCDWNRTKFTMDEDLSESVIDVFIDLFEKGKIYRGVRMVNWDPKALTAVSDEEVVYQEVQSKLYYIKYKIEGTENEYVTVATTRPETILGDVAVCMHPDDERFTHLKGKRCIVPLINRSIPLIFDEYVEKEFGTGALKITPAHDINDYHIGIKHKLPSINIFNDNGTLNDHAEILIGVDRFEAKKQIIPLLEAAGNLAKIEDYTNKVGFSERTNEVIEPKLSLQWFCDMTAMAKPALDVVMDDTIRFFPEKFKNTYSHWMENVKDWCISRQLWWGHRIPAYYLPNGEFVVAKTPELALEKANKLYPTQNFQLADLKQDEDVMDTWFSSWLWPISVFDGIRNPKNEEINYYYPTTVLITAPEIIFFWVARMVMAGIEWRENIPFKDVYFTGIVRDKQRRKMSKSLGNSPDPIDLINKYGADGVRVGMLFSSPAGNDLMFDESLCEQGRNFSNKIWNAFRLIKGWEICSEIQQPQHTTTAIEWFQNRINEALTQINDDFDKYRLSDALMGVYKLIWDDFCSVFLEIVKPPYQQPIDVKSYFEIIDLFEKLMRILHPFMPFITEELWHNISERGQKESIMLLEMPKPTPNVNHELLDKFSSTLKLVETIRRIRAEKNIPQKIKIELYIQKEGIHLDTIQDHLNAVIMKLCNLATIQYTNKKIAGAISFIEQNIEYFIPVSDTINVEEEIAKLKMEISYTEGFLKSVKGKLSNEKFVSGAPEQVVAMERKKLADAEEKIALLQEQIINFSK
ncbi:MAG: valine--tRNA ligase [Bacteroidetes bacterium HGW-Bacteroidetes-19]|nr:MAG: valine--tRNA ligase [Bacteroidetes bacterium HGW-Bacteroidetes-20]PKP28157.1 MAG: valine--tRNA ligase [Bacteroidetes bacterium HGW-Bacteroidetes-19]